MSSKRNEEEEKFWRKARSVKPGTWFTFEVESLGKSTRNKRVGRIREDYYKDSDGTVFLKRGPFMIDLRDPRKKIRGPSAPVKIKGRPVLSSPRENRIFSGKHDRRMFSERKKIETGAVVFPAKEPAGSRSRRRRRR